jgi:hypothetical protein
MEMGPRTSSPWLSKGQTLVTPLCQTMRSTDIGVTVDSPPEGGHAARAREKSLNLG